MPKESKFNRNPHIYNLYVLRWLATFFLNGSKIYVTLNHRRSQGGGACP